MDTFSKEDLMYEYAWSTYKKKMTQEFLEFLIRRNLTVKRDKKSFLLSAP